MFQALRMRVRQRKIRFMLTEQQLRQVEYLVNDEWVCMTDTRDDDRVTWRQFHAALDPMGPEELHQFAANFNCDCGVEALRRVIRHPRCDQGTALMIFWRLGPGWFFQYQGREEVEFGLDEYDLLIEIQSKYVAAGFESCEITTAPQNDNGVDWTRRNLTQGGIERVDPKMLRPSPGRKVELLRLQ
jgi:hypothetical protein